MYSVNQKVLQMIRESGQDWQPLYSWDHPNLHENVNFDRVGFRKDQRVELGVKAPDMHKAIEHIFNQIKPRLHSELHRSNYKVTGRMAQNMARDIFYRNITAASVKADVESLVDTYKFISKPPTERFQDRHGVWHVGTGGGWAPKGFR